MTMVYLSVPINTYTTVMFYEQGKIHGEDYVKFLKLVTTDGGLRVEGHDGDRVVE